MNNRRPLAMRFVVLLYVVIIPCIDAAQAIMASPDHTWSLDALAPSILLLLTAALIGSGLYMVRRWAYYALFFHLALVLLHQATLLNADVVAVIPYVAANVAIFSLVLFMLRQDQRMPYMSSDPRGWRSAERYACSADAQISLGELGRWRATAINLSRTGVLLTVPDHRVQLGDKVELVVGPPGHELRTPAFVMRLNGAQQHVGLQFAHLTEQQEAAVVNLVTWQA